MKIFLVTTQLLLLLVFAGLGSAQQEEATLVGMVFADKAGIVYIDDEVEGVVTLSGKALDPFINHVSLATGALEEKNGVLILHVHEIQVLAEESLG
ncbi:MAG: hypothetical protein KKB70_05550 [Proteobacteria bacterium]|nr:hypothetical protein [Pseudomonadota bacterium]MBU1611730.1 hypothetical protein [Pseudomonadota bacterium]